MNTKTLGANDIVKLFQRVDILEQSQGSNDHLINHSNAGIEKCFERIEKLEKSRDNQLHENFAISDRLCVLENAVKQLLEK